MIILVHFFLFFFIVNENIWLFVPFVFSPLIWFAYFSCHMWPLLTPLLSPSPRTDKLLSIARIFFFHITLYSSVPSINDQFKTIKACVIIGSLASPTFDWDLNLARGSKLEFWRPKSLDFNAVHWNSCRFKVVDWIVVKNHEKKSYFMSFHEKKGSATTSVWFFWERAGKSW